MPHTYFFALSFFIDFFWRLSAIGFDHTLIKNSINLGFWLVGVMNSEKMVYVGHLQKLCIPDL